MFDESVIHASVLETSSSFRFISNPLGGSTELQEKFIIEEINNRDINLFLSFIITAPHYSVPKLNNYNNKIVVLSHSHDKNQIIKKAIL